MMVSGYEGVLITEGFQLSFFFMGSFTCCSFSWLSSWVSSVKLTWLLFSAITLFMLVLFQCDTIG